MDGLRDVQRLECNQASEQISTRLLNRIGSHIDFCNHLVSILIMMTSRLAQLDGWLADQSASD